MGCRTRRSVRGCFSALAPWSGICARCSGSSGSARATSSPVRLGARGPSSSRRELKRQGWTPGRADRDSVRGHCLCSSRALRAGRAAPAAEPPAARPTLRAALRCLPRPPARKSSLGCARCALPHRCLLGSANEPLGRLSDVQFVDPCQTRKDDGAGVSPGQAVSAYEWDGAVPRDRQRLPRIDRL